jgi:5-methylcytosine-specific restriction endonuclease McrA
LTREKARLYIGLLHDDDGDRPVFRPVDAPRYCLVRLERENAKKEAHDRQLVALRDRINEIRGRVYSSRSFPSTLKAIIYERDNYTCQVCLRDRAELARAGLHLECDHILAWEDGGLTTYDNGQTICSQCNKAKHHAKTYLALVARLKGPGP